MWIFLGITGALAAIITFIAMLRVYIIVKSDDQGELMLRYKILWKTFGEDPDPNDPVVKALKKATGIENLERVNVQKDIQRSGLQTAISQTVEILVALFKEVLNILQYCTATKFEVHALCTSEDAAEAAITYGETCALVYPLLGMLENALKKVRPRGKNIDIRCSFDGEKEPVRYNFTVYLRMRHVLAALWRVSLAEARRDIERERQNQARKPNTPSK